MKKFTIVLTLAGLLLSVLGCEQGKSGPFTFTNNTAEKVFVLITQSTTVAREFNNDETYTGEDYYTPKIVFVKGLSQDEKKIIKNTFVASSINGFDYTFIKATGSNITISLKVPSDTYKEYEKWTLKEVNGKLGDDSSQSTVTFNKLVPPSTSSSSNGVPTKLYTDTPEFRIYRPKTVDGKAEEDITGFFSVILNKSEVLPNGTSTDTTSQITPTVQWTLEIIYPKIEQTQ